MKLKNEMESFLHMMAKFYIENDQTALPALLLDKGVWFEGRADSGEYPITKKWKKKNTPKAQDCFYNSQKFCIEGNVAQYFEGFVLIQKGMIPSEHCWIVMQDGRIVDFTLEALEIIAGEKGVTLDSRGALYVGLEVPRTFIVETLAETDWYEPIAELFYADQIERIAYGGQ